MRSLYTLIAIFTFISCEKGTVEEVIFSGTVVDMISQMPVMDANVKVTELYNVTWNSAESRQYGRFRTDKQGLFHFSYTDDSGSKLFEFRITHADFKSRYSLKIVPSYDSFIFELCPRQYENECY